jgi:hypothetical protein
VVTKCVQKYISIVSLLIACALPGMSQIFRMPAVVYPSGDSALSLAVADVNRDGKLDVVVATSGSVGVLLGNGDGTFRSVMNYELGQGASSVAVGDLNGDGWPDIVTGSENGSGCYECVGVLLNNGDGTFKPAVFYTLGGFDVSSVAVADVNGDGKQDLVLVSQCGNNQCTYSSVSVMLGHGDGSFGPAVSYSLGTGTSLSVSANSVAVADLNQDGWPDLLVANTSPGDTCGNGCVSVLINNGDGTFQPDVPYPSGGGGGAVSVVVGDVNGDGKLDAVVASPYFSGNKSGSVSVLLGNGDGSFGTAVVYSSGAASADSVAMGDVNGDGKPDIVVSSGGLVAVVSVLLNNGDGVFNTPAMIYHSGGEIARAVVMVDVNQDGKPDLVVADVCTGYGDGCPLGGGVAILLGVPARTTTTIRTSGSPSLVTQPVTFTATITGAYGPVSNGTVVTFYDNVTEIGTGTTANGAVQLITSSLAAKSHTIHAAYPSSAFFKASTGTVTQIVNLYVSTTTVTSTPNPSAYGQAVKLVATVVSGAPREPTGTVTFKQGTTALGTAIVSGGTAVLSTKKLPAGTLTITASYNGDAQSGKSSASTTQTVK